MMEFGGEGEGLGEKGNEVGKMGKRVWEVLGRRGGGRAHPQAGSGGWAAQGNPPHQT